MSPPSKMHALLKDTDMVGYRHTEMDVPRAAAHQTLVKVTKVGICGSDVPLHQWNEVGRSIATLPFIPGHEAVGRVVEIGPGEQPASAATLKPGDRVGIENHYYCERCYQCRHGAPHICAAMGQLGHGKLGHGSGMDSTIAMQGGCAGYALVPTKMLYRLGDRITDTQACLLEPMGVAHQGCEAAEVTAGDDVLITGCGAIGLLAVQICKAMGAHPIYATDVDDAKLELAKKFGATVAINSRRQNLKEVLNEATGGVMVGHHVECSGFSGVVNEAWEFIRKGGNLCLLGLPKSPVSPKLSGKDFLFRSITTRSIHGRKIFHTWTECEKLIASRQVKPELVVTHDFALSNYKEAFDTLLAAKGIKILMTPDEELESKL